MINYGVAKAAHAIHELGQIRPKIVSDITLTAFSLSAHICLRLELVRKYLI